jgi:nucleotide-binding universal stress UspA family protein
MTSGSTPQRQIEDPGSAVPTHKVVVGIDGSPSSKEAMEFAAQEATRRGASLQVVMAWDWPLGYSRTPMLHKSDPVESAREQFEAIVAGLQEAHPGLTIAAVFEHGKPASTLVDASKGADLLVVGSRGHGEFIGMLLGSVSRHCASQAHCPVLIHRSRR